jgi:hypothetical protein
MEAFTTDSPFNSSLETDAIPFIVQAVLSKQTAQQVVVSPVILSSDWGEETFIYH